MDTTLEIQNNTLDLDTINNLLANFGEKSIIFDENPLSNSLCTITEFITNNTPRTNHDLISSKDSRKNPLNNEESDDDDDCKSSSSSSSSSDCEAGDDQGFKQPKKKSKTTIKRKVNFQFIEDADKRAQAKCNRYNGIIKKIKWLDCLTGSETLLMNLDRKGKLKTYSVNTGVFESVLPKYKNLIGINKTKKQFKNSYALCDLKADSNKLSEASERILNCRDSDKIIYANAKMPMSRSVEFNSISSSDEEEEEAEVVVMKRKTKSVPKEPIGKENLKKKSKK